jgi:hypothetical protein
VGNNRAVRNTNGSFKKQTTPLKEIKPETN